MQSSCDRNQYALTITDHGCGVPEAGRTRVFERLYRVKRSEPSPQASGLGLAIAKAFEGAVNRMSQVIGGKGTTAHRS